MSSDFGSNDWLQLPLGDWGRSLWSVNEMPVASVGGQEKGWSGVDSTQELSATANHCSSIFG